ncbi:MAG: TPM domain-containing protein, partial [Okeania sp. SIO3B5]|uniref:TPM domain-containing protein n=1 Tax=Okeania sp. SIO3B5 TaxID=2607811 RepID=UPI0013FF6C69
MKFSVVIFKSAFWTISLSLALMLYSLSSLALTVQDVPNPRQNYGGWVTDMAEILSTDTEAKLNKMISDLEASNGSEIAVVTVSETQPAATPKKFATELFNYWGIGKKDRDNGVLFLVSQGDRRLEIETGKGVQEILPDAKVSHLLDTNIIPKFKLGLFESGVVLGTTALVTSLETGKYSLKSGKYSLAKTSVSENKILVMGIIIIILLVLVVLIVLIYMDTRNRPRSSYTPRSYSSYSSYSGGSRNNGSDNHTQRSSYSSIDTNDSDNDSSSDDDSFGGGSSDGGVSGANWSETTSSISSEKFGGGSSSGGGTRSEEHKCEL